MMWSLVAKGLRLVYVVFAFCYALLLGALKGLLVGPIAGLLLIFGNIVIIVGLFPAHVAWTVYAFLKTPRFDAALKVVLLFALPPLFGLWLGLSIAGSVLVGVGYGFFTPWVSTFEAFREDRESKKFQHCIVDGTWQTIKGSCTVVRDFTDFCYFSYPQLLKELTEGSDSEETQTIRLIHVPKIIIAGLMGLVVLLPLYTIISVLKSPYMLFKGWQRLLHDLISREGPFLETACVPVAGLVIIFWPLVVIGSILFAIFTSFFVGIYASVIVYQERSFRRGVAYIVAMISEFDEYTNDWLYLREGSILPKPRYRKKKAAHSSELSVKGGSVGRSKRSEAPAMLVPSLAPSRSVRETIQEVKLVQIWEDIMKSCEMRGKELIDAKVITITDLSEWLKARNPSQGSVIGVGVPCYALFVCLVNSIKAGSRGLVLTDGVQVTPENLPQDRLLEWFFQPFLVIKEQIKAIRLSEGELKFLAKLVLFGDASSQRMESWDNGSEVPQDAMKLAQIQAISRRLSGMMKSMSKFPTYRRRFRDVVKNLIGYCPEKESSAASHSTKYVASLEIV